MKNQIIEKQIIKSQIIEKQIAEKEKGFYSKFYFIIASTLMTVITALIYWPSLHYDFQFDDIANIQKYFQIRHAGLQNLFFANSRWISYWLNTLHYKIGKFDPFSYRIGNVLIHMSNGLLIFFILTFILTRIKEKNFFKNNAYALATITALLFLIHPVQTQTVSYVIQGQLEGLAMLATLSITSCFLWLTHTKNNLLYYLLCFILLALGALACGTKEIAIVIPVLTMLVDWFFVAQGSWKLFKKRIPLHLSLLTVIVGLYLYFLKPTFFTHILSLQLKAHNNIGNIITENPASAITPLHFLISQFKVIVHYLWMFIWPMGISVEYDWKLANNFFSPDSIFPFLLLASLAIAVYQLLKKNPTHPLAFGALWFAICIAPRSTIIPSPELLVDYKTYMGSFGWLLIIAAALIKSIQLIHAKFHHINHRINHSYAQFIVVAPLVILLGNITVNRNKVWRSGLDFWGNIIANAPGKARAYNNYGVELSEKAGKFAESIPYFKQAIAMDPLYPDPLNNIAVAYSQVGKIDAGIEALKQSLIINPSYPEGYNNLASFFLQKKEYANAQRCLETAIRIRPHYGKAYFNLGRLYFAQNDNQKGWECLKKCCMECDLDNVAGFQAYANASIALKKYDDALIAYKKILQLDPMIQDGEFNLANTYFFADQLDNAFSIYQKLLKQNPQDQRVWYNLGETYFKKNDPKAALECYNRSIDSQKDNPQLYMRFSACYEKLGDPAQAKKCLTAFSNKATNPQIKQVTTFLVAQLDAKYKLTA